MAEKTIVMYWDEETKFNTQFFVNPKNETVYAQDNSIEENGAICYDTCELAVNLEDMVKMRDALNYAIKKGNQYRREAGLEEAN